MKVLRIFLSLICAAILLSGLAAADSLQLRNGRHLQGKYIGGTTSAIGFMSGTSVEYFSTADVLALIFDNNPDPALGGFQPNAMRQQAVPSDQPSGLRRLTAQRSTRKGTPRLVQVSHRPPQLAE